MIRGYVIAAVVSSIFLLVGQPAVAGTTIVSFEQSEGFGAPGTAIEGLNTNGGLVTWSSANLWAPPGGLHVEDGPGGIGFGDAPPPITGTQEATASGLSGFKAQVIMELSSPMALTSFNYANRGNGPPRLEVEYFDASGQSLGLNAYSAPYDDPANPGTWPNGCAENFTTGCGVGLVGGPPFGGESYSPEFHLIKPTEPIQGVGLSKVIFSSFQNPERFDGDLNIGSGHGSFQLEDITLDQPTTTFNPDNLLRISFEANEGFPDHGGKPAPAPYNTPGGVILEEAGTTTGAGIPGIIDSFSIADNTQVDALTIDHGPGCGYPDGKAGHCIAATEPDPVFGTQMLHLFALGSFTNAFDDDFTLEIDLNNDAALAPKSFWYAYRGNGASQTVDIEYFDLSETSLGIESWSGSPDGGPGLGMDAAFNPNFDKIVIGEGTQTAMPTVKGVALSKMIINSTHNLVSGTCGNVGGNPNSPVPCSATFQMDDLLFECTTGNCPDFPGTGGTACDFNGDNECDDIDIDLLAAAVRNGTSDSKFNVDGVGSDVPDASDFDHYITDSAFLATGFGDHDLNKNVNFNDFVRLSNNFGNTGTGWNQGNGNTDNATNFNDFVRLSNNFGKTFASNSVPEPASIALAAIGTLVLTTRRKK